MKRAPIKAAFVYGAIAACSILSANTASPSYAAAQDSKTQRQKMSDKNEATNLALLLDAQSHFQTLMDTTENGYSKELQALADKLNLYNERNQLGIYSKIVVLDPLKAEIGIALGLPKSMIANTVLLQNGIRPYPTLSSMVGEFLMTPTPTTQKDSFTQNPHALFYVSDEKSPCIIIPNPVNTVPDVMQISGMTMAQQTEFKNLHEGFHCLDTRYHHRTFASEIYKSFDPANLQTLAGNQDGLDAYTNAHKAEAFADIAAIGELVRQGHPLSDIKIIEKWRQKNAESLVYMTAPELSALDKEIRKMGLETFRSYSDTKARDFYYSIVEEFGLSPSRLEAKLLYDRSNAAEKIFLEDVATHNIEFKKALSFSFSTSPATDNQFAALFTTALNREGFTPQQIQRMAKVEDKVTAWDAMDDLTQRTYKQEHAITPAALIKAYSAFQDELENLQKSQPDDADLYAAMSTKLKTWFTQEMIEFDFDGVGRNLQRQNGAVSALKFH